MQDVMPPMPAGAQLVQSYGPEGFRIGNRDYAGSVLVTEAATFEWNGEWTFDAFAPILAAMPAPEFLLLGTGKRHALIPPAFKQALKDKGLGIDSMDTGAACRTFNILLGEGRRVAAALRKV